MTKNYTYIFLISLLFLTGISFGQEISTLKKQEQPTIEGITIYPNPTNSGKIFISSKSTAEKKIEIFNVLGKKVLETTTTKEVNVSALTPGVYIIKIKENDASASRKLIIN